MQLEVNCISEERVEVRLQLWIQTTRLKAKHQFWFDCKYRFAIDLLAVSNKVFLAPSDKQWFSDFSKISSMPQLKCIFIAFTCAFIAIGKIVFAFLFHIIIKLHKKIIRQATEEKNWEKKENKIKVRESKKMIIERNLFACLQLNHQAKYPLRKRKSKIARSENREKRKKKLNWLMMSLIVYCKFKLLDISLVWGDWRLIKNPFWGFFSCLLRTESHIETTLCKHSWFAIK